MRESRARPGVLLYFSDLRATMEAVDDATLGRFIRHVVDYAQFAVLPDLDDPVLRMAFALIRPHLDEDRARYAEKVRHAAYASYLSAFKRAGNSESDAVPEAEWVRQNYGADDVPGDPYRLPDRNLPGTYQEPTRNLPAPNTTQSSSVQFSSIQSNSSRNGGAGGEGSDSSDFESMRSRAIDMLRRVT